MAKLIKIRLGGAGSPDESNDERDEVTPKEKLKLAMAQRTHHDGPKSLSLWDMGLRTLLPPRGKSFLG
jgi:hypothetical protein